MCKRGLILVSEGNAVQTGKEQIVCRVTKRANGRAITGTKVFQELERLGVSTAIIDSLWKAQESCTEAREKE